MSLKYLFTFAFLGYQKNFLGTQKRVRICHGKRAIGVRVTEVLLYIILKYGEAFLRRLHGTNILQCPKQTHKTETTGDMFSRLD